jgi:hypothetical protein
MVTQQLERDDRLPTEVDNEPWIWVESPHPKFPDDYLEQLEVVNGVRICKVSGKWCIFRSLKKIDDAWIRVREAVRDGNLGNYAKVSTMLHDPDFNPEVKVICVYTYDLRDEEDVFRVRKALRGLGFAELLRYICDFETMIATGEGNRRRKSLWRL